MNSIKKGSHVKIHTFTGGCYNGLTGKVTMKFVTLEKEITDDSWECVCNFYPGWYRVEFDTPIHIEERYVTQDIFMPSELTII